MPMSPKHPKRTSIASANLRPTAHRKSRKILYAVPIRTVYIASLEWRPRQFRLEFQEMRMIRSGVSRLGGTILFAAVGMGAPLALSGCGALDPASNAETEDTAALETGDDANDRAATLANTDGPATTQTSNHSEGSANLDVSGKRQQPPIGNPVEVSPATPDSEGRTAATPATADANKGE